MVTIDRSRGWVMAPEARLAHLETRWFDLSVPIPVPSLGGAGAWSSPSGSRLCPPAPLSNALSTQDYAVTDPAMKGAATSHYSTCRVVGAANALTSVKYRGKFAGAVLAWFLGLLV